MSEMELNEAAERSRELAKSFRALLAVGDAIRRINDLDIATSSAQAMAKRAGDDLRKVQTELKQAQERMTAMTSTLEALREQTEKEKAEYAALAKKMRDEAENEAVRIRRQAEVQAERIEREAAARVEVALSGLAETQRQEQESRDSLLRLKEQLAALVKAAVGGEQK